MREISANHLFLCDLVRKKTEWQVVKSVGKRERKVFRILTKANEIDK